MMNDPCVIYCLNHDCYWKKDSTGYGPLNEAEIYPRQVATKHASNPERDDVVVPLSELQDTIKHRIAGLQRLVI